jgi:deoxyribonuclease V
MRRHCWNVSVRQAYAIQESLKKSIIREDTHREIASIGGVDVAYEITKDRACCVITVFSYPDMELQSTSFFSGEIGFGYIPGLFTFREGPLIEQAFERLETVPELLIFDGQGICHPTGIGIATHMGLYLDIPSIGCAKSHLFGTYDEPGLFRGDRSHIYSGREVIGCVLRTRDFIKPVFISQGHRVSLESSIEVCLACCLGYRIPEPVRMAHILAKKISSE